MLTSASQPKNVFHNICLSFGNIHLDVTFIAVVFGVNANQKDIGVGAALGGGPLVLSTIAYAIIGLGIIYFRKRRTQGPLIYFPWLIVTIVVYMALAQTIKTLFARKFGELL
jgi:cation:H+ antiporter